MVESALKDLRTSLAHCVTLRNDPEHRLWDSAFLQGMLQDASACCELLRQQEIQMPGFHFPLVAAAVTALLQMAIDWKRHVHKHKLSLAKSLNRKKNKNLSVSAAWSGPPLLPSHQQKLSAGSKPVRLTGFMLNFGLSGGMNPTGETLAVQRWWDFALYVQSLECDFGFAIGCRRPEGLDISQAIPGYPFEVTGHASLAYDAVAFFCLPPLLSSIHWMPDKSKTTRSCWVHVAGAGICSALYVPPPSSASREERRDIVLMYFREWDDVSSEAKSIGEATSSRLPICGCGDLNMTPDLMLLFEQCLHSRDLGWATESHTPTHVKGGILDFFWCERGNTTAVPVLHDGQVCHSQGCRNPLCGNLQDATASNDLDHHAWTFSTYTKCPPNLGIAFGLHFVKDVDQWTCAVTSLGDKVMDLLALDISTALPSCRAWPWSSSQQRKRALNTCAALWDVVMTMVGYASGLVKLKPLSRSSKVPHAVKQAFHALVKASKLKSCDSLHRDVALARHEARCEYRQQVSLHRSQVLRERCNRYMQLSSSNDPQAHSLLTKCLKKNVTGLPDNMVHDSGEVICNHEVLNGAADYIMRLQLPPATADLEHRLLCENKLLQLRADMRSKVNADMPLSGTNITPELLQQAYCGIDPSAECRGLPYAALLTPTQAHSDWILSLHMLAYVFALTPDVWTRQNLYHTLKPGRAPNSFMSYRILGLNAAQGRLQEELLLQLEPGLWGYTGRFQEGRQECLVVVAADVCVANLRQDQGLPFGLCLNDRKEAFDSQWRASMLINLASCVSHPRSWCLMDELLRTTSLSVVKLGARSKSFSMRVGVVQGRKLSPVEFCVGQKNLEDHASRHLVGVGLNPPKVAVEAYHKHKDGKSADKPYDLNEPARLFGWVSDGVMSWSEAFSSASSDTCRLTLLDLASPVRRSVRSFMDDTRIPVASHGHASCALNVLQNVAALEQYMYKPSKCSVVASGFSQRAPINLQGSAVHYVTDAVQLGISLDTRFDGAAHLQLIMARGPGRMKCLIAELVNLGMPMQALLSSMRTRLTPAVTFGIELVIQIPYAEKHLNGLQAKWMRAALGCLTVPRVVMMLELGIRDRLSVIAWARALMLRRRARLDPRYAQEEEIFRLAESSTCSWASVVHQKECDLHLPLMPPGCEGLPTNQLKAKLHYHAQTVVLPALRALELTAWYNSPKILQYWSLYSSGSWTVADLAPWGISIADAQAWAQLKLQGHLSNFDGSGGPSVPCSFCNRDDLETTEHLFLSCPRALVLLETLLSGACQKTRLTLGSNLARAVDVLPWVEAAGKLARSKCRGAS